MIPDAAVAHYKRAQRLQSRAVLEARRSWSQVDPDDLSRSWEDQLLGLVPAVTAVQVSAAEAGASYSATTMAQQGLYEAPEAFVDPNGFAGQASDGRPLDGLLYAAVPYVKNLIEGGMSAGVATVQGGKFLDMVTKTQIADAGRAAAGVDIAARPGVGYVRMLNPPSCARCSLLAGRFYRWNNGFLRHPKCDCIHVASTQSAVDGGESEGLVHDPYDYFNSLSASEQDKLYTKTGAQAVRDGGDIFQVVNSRRGMKPGGLITTEGTTRRGAYGAGRAARLTPEGIYSQGLPRDETLRLLETNGYVLPGGQNPLGSIRGQREGFGALGRGGTRIGARNAVLEARRTGVRDPNSRYTMTAAEKRVADARTRWAEVQQGVNPFNRNKKLTPEIAARIERDYRKYILGY